MQVTRENKMGVWSENRLLLSMSIPIMISMLAQALYNVFDSYYVSRYGGADALTALGLAFPIQNLMIAVATGAGVGMNALLSRSLGEKQQEKANRIAMQGLTLAVICYVLFLLIGLFGVRGFIGMQTNNQTVFTYGVDYLRICCIFSFGLFFQVATERLLQATGRTLFSMLTQGIGAVTNIVLDRILIFGLFGFPQMGVIGAAYATIIGQILAGCVGLLCNALFNRDITLKLKNLRPDFRLLGQILYIGIPSIIMAAIGSVMTFAMNKILAAFTYAVAVFTVYFKLQSFVFMPVFGLNNGMVPIVAYNLGARKRSRILKTIKLSAIYATAIMLGGLLVIQRYPAEILQLFNAEPEMLQVGITALRTISLCFVFAGVSIVISSVCQAVGKSIYSMVVSIGRQLVILIPAAFLLSLTGKVNLIWLAFPIAEVVSLVMCLFFLRQIKKGLDF